MTARRATALAALACALFGVAGCGEDEGVADGAAVTAYAEAPLCAAAQSQAGEVEGTEGTVKLRVVCLADPRRERGGIELATIGANARRASEDSTTVAFLELADPRVNRFTHPILEAAGIAWIADDSGKIAMQRLLNAVKAADSDSLRDAVRESLG